jgi:ubiquinone/menaquinone biosynthesis C-methylase UbiE
MNKKYEYLNAAYTTKEKPLTEYPDKLIKHILGIINFNKNNCTKTKVLDVGCGRGDQLKSFEKMNFDAHGLDLEFNSQSLIKNLSICDFRISKMPFQDETFDIIFCKSVIEHLYLKEIENLMIETKRILKKGGFFIILTPAWEYNVKNFYTEYSHVTPFTKRSLKHCIESYTFKNIEVQYLIQLPFVWKYPISKLLCDFINLLSLPRKFHKIIKWSQERMLMGISQKL